jgi:hypothetical protein
MQKNCFLLLILCLLAFTLRAQIPSPEAFLGYPIGAKYTPHYRIVQYFEAVAAASPTTVKLQRYGQTNEGRPLMIAFIGRAENIARLEDIRKNNLRLAGMLDDQPATEATPVIVWLSYNVHGNEPSSSEAAMQTLFALTDPTNTDAAAWLKNTVVVIDPCLNPDGRDRYVHWFNDVVGDVPNPNLQSREHDEPWPGGRTNHYNFDLNRDWFWQTQRETQQRLKLYNDWLPQVHVDYHEQGINAPYYFAPAAEPYHEVITHWQRDFQVAIGKNNARYFDRNGWLFFTKQEFDLFYPSYGDTYPLYNGSIGMTYEQAGNSGGGLAALMDNGDTLTLRDRVMHHVTTGLSTVEISAQHAADLLREFHTYFQHNIQDGAGPYQTYVVCADSLNEGRITDLRALLDRNGIRYGTAKGAIRGYDYFARAEDRPYTIQPWDIVIPAHQPKATLLKVLFEPNSRISDSITYDITAWSLPYVYGLRAFASKEAVSVKAPTMESARVIPAAEAEYPYGYVIRWTDAHSAETLCYLLQHHVKVRVSQASFEEGGQTYGPGSLLVLLNGSNEEKQRVAAVLYQSPARSFNVLHTGFVDKGYDFGSDKVRPAKAPKVALLTGDDVSSTAAGEVWHLFERELGYPITLINASNFPRLFPGEYDVIIMPDGYYPWLNDKKASDLLRTWVNQGGRLIAMESAASQLAGNDWGFKAKKSDDEKKDDADKSEPYANVKGYGNRDRDEVRGSVPGAIYRVDMDSTHPLAFGFPSFYYTLRQDNTVYQFMEEGWNVGILKKNNYVSGFVGSKAKQQMEDGLLFGVEDMGRGKIVFLADDPLFRDFWENGKLLFCNAVFMVGN